MSPDKDASVCEYCGATIRIMVFRGRGYCCENHRKALHLFEGPLVGEPPPSMQSSMFNF